MVHKSMTPFIYLQFHFLYVTMMILMKTEITNNGTLLKALT
jgi:hypothetical protein